MASRCIQMVRGKSWLRAPCSRPSSLGGGTAAPPLTPQHTPVRHATTTESGIILEEPKREVRFGLIKIFATVFAGLSIGAWMSQKFAAFLEENELFVPDDDDDDDD